MAIQSPNYTQIPNEIIDKWMRELSSVELAVVLAICRKTFGWQKERDKISLSQLQEITGSARDKITEAIKALEAHDIISCVRAKNRSTLFEIKVVAIGYQSSSQGLPDEAESSSHRLPTKESIKKTNKRKAQAPAVKSKLNGTWQMMVDEIFSGNKDLGLDYSFTGYEQSSAKKILNTLEDETDDPSTAKKIFIDKASAFFNKLRDDKWMQKNGFGYTFAYLYKNWNNLRWGE